MKTLQAFQAVNCNASLSLPFKGNYSTLTCILIYSTLIFNLNGTSLEPHLLFALGTIGIKKTFFPPFPERLY